MASAGCRSRSTLVSVSIANGSSNLMRKMTGGEGYAGRLVSQYLIVLRHRMIKGQRGWQLKAKVGILGALKAAGGLWILAGAEIGVTRGGTSVRSIEQDHDDTTTSFQRRAVAGISLSHGSGGLNVVMGRRYLRLMLALAEEASPAGAGR